MGRTSSMAAGLLAGLLLLCGQAVAAEPGIPPAPLLDPSLEIPGYPDLPLLTEENLARLRRRISHAGALLLASDRYLLPLLEPGSAARLRLAQRFADRRGGEEDLLPPAADGVPDRVAAAFREGGLALREAEAWDRRAVTALFDQEMTARLLAPRPRKRLSFALSSACTYDTNVAERPDGVKSPSGRQGAFLDNAVRVGLDQRRGWYGQPRLRASFQDRGHQQSGLRERDFRSLECGAQDVLRLPGRGALSMLVPSLSLRADWQRRSGSMVRVLDATTLENSCVFRPWRTSRPAFEDLLLVLGSGLESRRYRGGERLDSSMNDKDTDTASAELWLHSAPGAEAFQVETDTRLCFRRAFSDSPESDSASEGLDLQASFRRGRVKVAPGLAAGVCAWNAYLDRPRRDTTWRGRLKVSGAPREGLELGLGLEYAEQRSDDTSYSYDATRCSVEAAFSL